MEYNTQDEQDYDKKFDFSLWKKLFRYTIKYKKLMIYLTIVMISVAGVDVAFPLMSKYAIDNFVIPKNFEGIWMFTSIFFGMVLLQGINVYFLIALAGKIDMWICYDIRKDGFNHLQELSFSYYDKTPIGWIMARMTSDTQKLGDIIAWGLVDFVWGFSMMGGIVFVLFYLDWKLALITLSVVPFLVFVSFFFQKKILKSYRSVRKLNSKITGSFAEGISGAKTTKTLVREDANLKDFKGETGIMYSSSVRAAILSSLFLPIVLTFGSIGTGFALWFGGESVIMGAITYGTLVAFISYTILFFEPIRELARIFAEFQSAQASAERIISMIETKPEIMDSEKVLAKYGDLHNPKRENWEEISGDIKFDNVSFKYGNDGEKVLTNFNLEIKAGQNIALVGETGSGKSTIVNLACRFFEPTEGQILIDGFDYRERSKIWLQSNLGYVLQTPHLFSGTIAENIKYGNLEASQIQIENAAKLVNAHEFIMKMEKGYHSSVGEGGNLLSTGEKQLISFARAILANPKIFILDEATSSIDTETERNIQNAIKTVLENRTSFIVAHRLSTIRSADRILVINKGRVTEDGNHYELMEKKGYYYKLYTNQFIDETERDVLSA